MAKVLRFDGLWPGYEEWRAKEDERLGAVFRAERMYVTICLVWSTGRGWPGMAKLGAGGPYAIAVRFVPDVVESKGTEIRYVPREGTIGKAHTLHVQPRTPEEAVAAIRAEEAREIAIFGEPDAFRSSVTVKDGNPEKAEAVIAHIRRIEDRLDTEMKFAERFRFLRLVWAPFCRWRLRRVKRKDWTA